jgi:hypothetical protein
MGRARARRQNSPEEFPMLNTLGLMAVKIKGDGMCSPEIYLSDWNSD